MMEICDNKNNNSRTTGPLLLSSESVCLVEAENLSFKQVSREFGVVDGTFFALFLSDHEGIDVLGVHLFTDGEEDVSQFSSEDGAVGFFVENSQTFNEVFKGGGLKVFLDLVVDWHVFFEGNKLGAQVFFGWVSKGLVNFGVGWVKAESTDAVGDNGDGNFAFTAHVEKTEHFFEVSKLIFSVVTHFVVIDLSDLTSEKEEDLTTATSST